jgi:hypothetical protein
VEMGDSRTGDRTLGRPAMNGRAAACLLGLCLLSGCKTIPQLTAAVSGGAAGAATGNPAVGFAVGVATDAVANYVVRWYGRVQQGAEQDVIAQLAGGLPLNDKASWQIHHFLPFNDEHGELRVVSVSETQLATCRHVIFSVDEGSRSKPQPAWYATDICKGAQDWKWAAAEPAVARWGYLQ